MTIGYMKTHLFFVLLLFILGSSHVSAQKFGYVDMEYITGKMPDYQKAQADVDKFSERWTKEIQDKFAEIDRLQRVYQAEEVLLTDDLKRKRQQEITDKAAEAREYNNKIFGFEGMLFQKKKETIKTVTDQVYKAMEKVARQRKLDFIFDKSSEFVVVYSNPVHDYTDYIMEELGLNTDNKNNKNNVNATATPTVAEPNKKESSNKSKSKQ
jgi:outer membrane protein